VTKSNKVTNELFQFFDITEPMFISTQLNGKFIKRFVDRTFDLKFFRLAVQQGQNCAVLGEQGIGKSSFLLKLKQDIADNDKICGFYQQFSLNLQDKTKITEYFLRTVLRNLISLIIDNDELLKGFKKKDLLFEADRLEYSIFLESLQKNSANLKSEIEGGIKGTLLDLLIPANFGARLEKIRLQEKEERKTKEFPFHNENTLKETIEKLSNSLLKPVALFIDELDKAGREPLKNPEWDKEVHRILELSSEIMTNRNLVFVFSLQKELQLKLEAVKKNKNKDFSILGLVPVFREIKGFDLEFAFEAIDKSLSIAGYKGGREKLFEDGVIEITLSATEGNPRLFMNYLAGLTTWACLYDSKTITMNVLKSYLIDIYGDIINKNWKHIKETRKFLIEG
jgi:hypothetical protein